MVIPSIRRLAPSFFVSSLLAGSVGGDVLVVDSSSGPGTDFIQIAAAVSAAAPSDVILVRSGGYQPFTVDGKKVTVVAEAGAAVWADDVVVTGLASEQSALFQGIRFRGSELAGTALRIESCAGPVTVEDGEIVAPSLMFIFASAHAASVTSSDSVTFVQTGITTERPFFPELDGGPGLTITDATVHLFDCTVQGGVGMSANGAVPAHPGGPGVLLQSGFLFAEGSTLRGGDGGGDTSGPGCEDGADGGPGLVLGAAGPALIFVGILDGTGELELQIPLKPLGAPVALLHMQGLFLSAVDGFLLSSPHALAILDL